MVGWGKTEENETEITLSFSQKKPMQFLRHFMRIRKKSQCDQAQHYEHFKVFSRLFTR